MKYRNVRHSREAETLLPCADVSIPRKHDHVNHVSGAKFPQNNICKGCINEIAFSHSNR